MNVRISLLVFLLTLLITDNVNARKFGFGRSSSLRGGSSRGGLSRGGSSRGSYSSSSRSSSSYSPGHGSSSRGHSTGSSSTGYGSSSGGQITGASSQGYSRGLPSGSPTSGLNPGQTSHQQNKDASTNFLHVEGGGAMRPSQTNSAQSGRPPVSNSNTGTSGNREIGFATENKQTSVFNNPGASHNPSAPYNPSAPSTINNLPKLGVIPSQSHNPTSFGQPSVPYNPPHDTSPSKPSWSNPHFTPKQPYPSDTASTNIGFKDHLRPSFSVPGPSAPYPHPSYPISGNIHSRPLSPAPPYPGHSFSHSNQPHSTYNPSYSVPSHTFGYPSSYPAHIPPPVPGTFGNPYSTHPVNGPHGHAYYPQQHVLSQPAAQPYIPGQTVIMVPGQQDSGRGIGQMVKEALVFSTINAGVNRLINPYPHFGHDYSSSPSRTGTSNSETHITYNNHYFNTAPADGNASPSSSSNVQWGNTPSVSPAILNPVNNPVITPGVSTPIIVHNGSTTYPVGTSSVVARNTVNNNEAPSIVPSDAFATGNVVNNQQDTPIYFPQYKISDDDLLLLTEELFAKQEVDVSKYLRLHLQSKSENVTDAASGPLIYVQKEAYNYPTILAIRALYDNYEHNSTVKETRTPEKRKKEDLLLNVFLNTNVMSRAMRWLSDRGFIDPDDFEKKDVLRHLWLTTFDGATSGFERVFTSESYGTELLGVQDWIYFNYQESNKRIDYMGYTDTMKLGDKASLVKLNFQMDGIVRPNTTIFVGTLPELEMSLYTICFYARPNNLCPVSLGGSKFNIFTHAFRYYGKDLIDLALPIF